MATRPRRLTSDEARQSIMKWMEKDSNSSESSSESDVESDSGSDKSFEMGEPHRSSDSEMDVEVPVDQDVDLDEQQAGCSTAPDPRPSLDFTAASKSRSRPKGMSKSSGKGKGLAKGTLRSTPTQASSSAPAGQAQPSGVTWGQVDSGSTVNNLRDVSTRLSGVNENVVGQDFSPLACLRTLLTDEIMNDLVEEINNYAAYRCQLNNPPKKRSLFRDWHPVTFVELLKFWAVLIAIGINPKPRVKDYHCVSRPYLHTPWFGQMFPRDRFSAIYHSMFHVSEVGAEGKAKIEPLVNRIIKRFQDAFYPYTNLALDEMVIGWKGRFAHKMFNASKPKKYHVKTFGLCDSNTGYVVDLLLYFGSNTSYNPLIDTDSQQAVKVFDKLLESCGPGHHIFADRYYTSYPLLEYLSSKGHYYTGTLNTTRKHFPPELKTARLEHKEIRHFMEEDKKYLVTMFRDKKAKKPVVMVSSNASTETIDLLTRAGPVTKPLVIHDYNNNMDGCDRVDRNVGSYGMFKRRTRKWWKNIFYWVFEICQLNAFILYILASSTEGKKMPLVIFKDKLISELCTLAAASIIQNPVPRGHTVAVNPARNIRGKHILVKHPTRCRQCVVCSRPDSRKRTRFYCEGCPTEPHLHPNTCHKEYHA